MTYLRQRFLYDYAHLGQTNRYSGRANISFEGLHILFYTKIDFFKFFFYPICQLHVHKGKLHPPKKKFHTGVICQAQG